jgi:hypothetical protein
MFADLSGLFHDVGAFSADLADNIRTIMCMDPIRVEV